MNASTITALIGSITALIGAISGLIILIVHIRNHDPIPLETPVEPTANGTAKTITKPPTL